MFYNVLLFGRYQNTGEASFVGALQGLLIAVFFYGISIYKKKQASKKHIKKEDALKDEEKKVIGQEIYNTSKESAPKDFTTNMDRLTNLYEELKSKCDPERFMNPYNAQKVDIANQIYSQIEAAKNSEQKLEILRNEAIKLLSITFSTDSLFYTLSEKFNPQKFMGENYDANKLKVANEIYSDILKNKNDIIKLEQIARTYKDVLKEDTKIKKENCSNNLKYLLVTLFIIITFIIFTLSKANLNIANSSSFPDDFIKEYESEIRRNETSCGEMMFYECISKNEILNFSYGGPAPSPFNDGQLLKDPATVTFHGKNVTLQFEGKEYQYKIKKFKGLNSAGNDNSCVISEIYTESGEELLYARYYSFYNSHEKYWFVCKIDDTIYNFSEDQY